MEVTDNRLNVALFDYSVIRNFLVVNVYSFDVTEKMVSPKII